MFWLFVIVLLLLADINETVLEIAMVAKNWKSQARY